MRWRRAASSISCSGAPASMRSTMAPCSHTDSWRGRERRRRWTSAGGRGGPIRPAPGHHAGVHALVNSVVWNSWLRVVNSSGSKWSSVAIMRSLIARACCRSAAVSRARGKGGRGAFQDAQGDHAVAVLRLVDHRHLRAHVVLEGHESLGLEMSDCLTHGDDAHVEFLGDRTEHQPVAGGVFVGGDAFLDPLVGLLRLALSHSSNH